MFQLTTYKCPHCGAIVAPRVANPVRCARCGKPLNKETTTEVPKC